jgi:hypothetical protein
MDTRGLCAYRDVLVHTVFAGKILEKIIQITALTPISIEFLPSAWLQSKRLGVGFRVKNIIPIL